MLDGVDVDPLVIKKSPNEQNEPSDKLTCGFPWVDHLPYAGTSVGTALKGNPPSPAELARTLDLLQKKS